MIIDLKKHNFDNIKDILNNLNGNEIDINIYYYDDKYKTNLKYIATNINNKNKLFLYIDKNSDINFDFLKKIFDENKCIVDIFVYNYFHEMEYRENINKKYVPLSYNTDKFHINNTGISNGDLIIIINSLILSNTKMKCLIINCNNITDITPIKYLDNIEKIYLYNNRHLDLTPLCDMINLKIIESDEFVNGNILQYYKIYTFSDIYDGNSYILYRKK